MFIARPGVRRFVVLALCVVMPVMTTLAAQTHVVPLAELHQQAAAVTEARQANLAKAGKFFSTAAAEQALRTVKLDSGQVMQAMPLLSNEELARLASRMDAAGADLAGGALSNQELTYIVIALATAVLILVIIKAR